MKIENLDKATQLVKEIKDLQSALRQLENPLDYRSDTVYKFNGAYLHDVLSEYTLQGIYNMAKKDIEGLLASKMEALEKL